MDTKLIDFDSQQLQTLLDIVVARIMEEDKHKGEWILRFNGDDEEFGSAWYDLNCRALRPVNYEHLCLWRTQILNAIGKVGVQDEINSN